MALSIIAPPAGARIEAPVLACEEGLSFWGGVDAATGQVIDAHHPLHGRSVAGAILAIPTSRGSCTGSGVLLELIQNGHAPAALVFREAEDVLTLGALVGKELYGRELFDAILPVLRLPAEAFARLSAVETATLDAEHLTIGDHAVALSPLAEDGLTLSEQDRAMLDGADGLAVETAMRVIRAVAAAQGAERLIDVSQVHIDGCIYASPALLRVAERFREMGGKVRVPTTMNAISVDYDHWREQGTPPAFGGPAHRLAEAYVQMGARPSFTCAPYLLETAPKPGETIAWAESNAVIYANSVLGARTAKHPDFLDLCIALTGRAPEAGVYLDAERQARRVIAVEAPDGPDDAFWPMLGYLAGLRAPDRIPLLTGLERLAPSEDDLKALCGAFGASSAAPMLHIAGVTPEAGAAAPDADAARIGRADFARAWAQFNAGPAAVDLIALGSPHFSHSECRRFAALMDGARCAEGVTGIITLGRASLAAARAEGIVDRLESAGFRVQPDLCWCSISEPVFPPAARTLMTNSGKYAHYAPGLSGRAVRFGSLADCAEAARTGRAPEKPPGWLG